MQVEKKKQHTIMPSKKLIIKGEPPTRKLTDEELVKIKKRQEQQYINKLELDNQ